MRTDPVALAGHAVALAQSIELRPLEPAIIMRDAAFVLDTCSRSHWPETALTMAIRMLALATLQYLEADDIDRVRWKIILVMLIEIVRSATDRMVEQRGSNHETPAAGDAGDRAGARQRQN